MESVPSRYARAPLGWCLIHVSRKGLDHIQYPRVSLMSVTVRVDKLPVPQIGLLLKRLIPTTQVECKGTRIVYRLDRQVEFPAAAFCRQSLDRFQEESPVAASSHRWLDEEIAHPRQEGGVVRS